MYFSVFSQTFPTTWWLMAKGPTQPRAHDSSFSLFERQHASRGDGKQRGHPRDRWITIIGYQIDHYGEAALCKWEALQISMFLRCDHRKTVQIYCRKHNKTRLKNIILFQNWINRGRGPLLNCIHRSREFRQLDKRKERNINTQCLGTKKS